MATSGQAGAINPLDVKKPEENEDSKFISSIVNTETSEEVNILEAPPELDNSLLADIEPPKSILLLILKIVFGVMLVGGIISVGFFSSQLSSKFEFISSYFGITTPASQMTAINTEILKFKDESNFYNFLQLKAYLDQFSYYGDNYLQNFEISNSQTASESEKTKAKANLEKIKPDLKNSFEYARKLIIQPFATPLINLATIDNEYELNKIFETSLQEKLMRKAEEVLASENAQAKRDYKNYLQAIKLVGNRELKQVMMETDFAALNEEQIYALINKINKLILNDLSIIHEIKTQRVKWSDIMREIERRTIAVDPQYNDKYYEELGGIRYTSYDFDAESRRISIIGETKLISTTNFTMISNLIDEFNRSLYFTNADMKSFSKSGSLEDGYTASLQLSLDLKEEKSADNESEKIDPDFVPEFLEENNNIER